MFLGGFSVPLTLNLNSKFRSFLVRILSRKDNTDNKVFKRNFIQRIKKERDRKDKVLQIIVQFAGNLSERVSGKQSSLNLIFFFSSLFYRKVSEFFEFRVFFKVLFRRILGWIFFPLNFLRRTSVFDFHLMLLLFLGELHSWSEWRKPTCYLSSYQFCPRIRTKGQTSSLTKGGSYFLVPHCLGLLISSPFRPNQAPHLVSRFFS